MVPYKIFAINPGSTSTKIALFEGNQPVFSSNVSHDAEVLKQYREISDQFDYRKETILEEVEKAGVSLEGVDAFSARGGGLVSVEAAYMLSMINSWNMPGPDSRSSTRPCWEHSWQMHFQRHTVETHTW